MNKKTLLSAALAALFVSGSWAPSSFAADPSLKTDEDKISYSMGLMFGQRVKTDMPQLNMDGFLQGIQDGYAGSEPKLTQEEMQATIQSYQQKRQQEQLAEMNKKADENKAKGDAYLAENAKRKGIETTKTGLQIETLKAGAGAQPAKDSKVTVHYTGSLLDGTVFDSSRDRGEPVTFKLSDVIPGWTEGLQLMKEGGQAKLVIPSNLAYGPGGNRAIGPNETLIFDVELIKVEKGE